MSETEQARMPMRRGLRILLVASLALNLAFIGLAVGAALNWHRDGPPRSFDLSGGPLAQALPREDRRAIGQALRGLTDVRPPTRQERREMLESLAEVLRADPFDPTALETEMMRVQGRVDEVRAAASEITIARIAAMTPQQRDDLAEALLRGHGEERRGN